MTYDEWQLAVPESFRTDPLWKMAVYRKALFLADLAWPDVTRLMGDARTVSLSDQLYRAAGSIEANIAEGYSKRSRKDRVRFYEYALGSSREARGWYYKARYVLSEQVVQHRTDLLAELAKLLLTMIAREDDPRFG
jgi:four helix bundle protein